ncbi:chaperonin 10-like protein [Desarmillaria tabescens]|uniref:Chaperonin 10-like protein n=1 Tax=Armillaria tabescens TaxID=1929756 RepID=A0AA39JNG6_ARMTA|nr:chaperonin 10-like protein [Desarmillaria tabescens]KAK0445990.1 chaperonin 10-like protein [Desarmillaria tabescens]
MFPSTMEAVYYHGANNLDIITTPIPQIKEDEVLIKIACCGVCGTDHHISQGEFITKFPLTPGHEMVGRIAKVGQSVKGFAEGDRVVADPGITCGNCFYCRRGTSLLCENFESLGCTVAGGFAEYAVAHQKKVYKIFNLTDEEATLIEPASCAIHGADKLNLPVGSEVLIIGSGPTGLILSQLLKIDGASKVVLVANKGIKTRIAKELGAADEYIELDRENPQAQWDKIKVDYPYGFNAVIEATGSEKVANDAINYVRRGGTLMVYGVYANADRVHWPPSKIFRNEIRIIGSFAQTYCFPRAVAYLDSGKINVKGMVTDAFEIKDFQKALDKMNSKEALKVIIKPAQK